MENEDDDVHVLKNEFIGNDCGVSFMKLILRNQNDMEMTYVPLPWI